MISEQNLSAVDLQILSACAPPDANTNCVLTAVRYHLAAGGNRLRARFCLEASQSLGIDALNGLTLAAICESLHNASLIQDDLLDRASVRRNQGSVWAVFGDATAVCAGDLLLAGASGLVGELTDLEFMKPALSLVTRRTQEVILGQGEERLFVMNDLESYELLAAGKSASLLSLPLELPLLLSGNVKFCQSAQHATKAFAVAYQMLDDLADYDEDMRNNSPNAVTAALALGSSDFRSACSTVCSRADALMQSAIDDARQLPMNCAAAMIAYAERARLTLSTREKQGMRPVEEMLHGA